MPIAPILATLFSGVEAFFKSDEDKAKAKLLMQQAQGDLERALIEAQSSVIKTELDSKSWIAENWRAILMLSFVLIINMNYVIFPLLRYKFPGIDDVPMPADLWTILKIGLAGYLPGHTIEKMAIPIINAVKGKQD